MFYVTLIHAETMLFSVDPLIDKCKDLVKATKKFHERLNKVDKSK